MHSGAEVDIEGDFSASQPSDVASAALSRGSTLHMRQSSDKMMVPFALLIPIIQPHLEKDKAIQMDTLFNKLKKNEISRDGFLRSVKRIVGKKLINMATLELQENIKKQELYVSFRIPSPTGSSPSPPGKKQKVSGDFTDQSIERLNDVAAVSGINIREEEKQLLAGPKESSRTSESARRIVQEDEKLILQRIPLHERLAGTLTKCGLNSVISKEVERCLSLCLEERMRGLISKLVRRSKQRIRTENQRYRTFSSDVGRQIAMINKKAREEEQKRKQGDEKKVKNLCEVNYKCGKLDDKKMQTNAANIAARAAIGGDDMMLKWKLTAEQSRKHKYGGGATDSQTGSLRKNGNIEGTVPIMQRISVRDVIAVLERDQQISKSTLMYRLYERLHTYVSVEKA